MLTHTIKGPQGSLAVTVSTVGSSTPAIFLHADLGSRHQWDEVLANLGELRPFAAPDRRGHGESEPPANGRFGIIEETDDVLAVADSLGFDQFGLIGHSGGAAVAFQLANTNPGRVAGLLLLDPPPDPKAIPNEQRTAMLDGVRSDPVKSASDFYRSIAGSDSGVVERVLRDVRSTPPQTIAAVTEAMFEFDPASVAGRFEGPSLSIIQSQFDGPQALHRLGPGMPHRSLDGAGHWLQLGAPGRIAPILDEFLASIDEMAVV